MKQRRKVLLLEPNYKNKYPPMGLMKLATYYRLQGDDVVFWKGDEKEFVARELTGDFFLQMARLSKDYGEELVFSKGTSIREWKEATQEITVFIKTGKMPVNGLLEGLTKDASFLYGWLSEFRKRFKTGAYYRSPRWDIVGVTTLFTFYWDITVETIEFAKKICKDWKKNVQVGGVLATVVGDELQKKTGVNPHRGVLSIAHFKGDKPLPKPFSKTPIDELPLDYSILDEIDYQYPETNAYYGYMTRGCVNKCKFCAVPVLEPEYRDYIPLGPRVKWTTKHFGEQRNLLLLDNNVFASKQYDRIIDDIRDCGFGAGSTFTPPNQLEVAIQHLKSGWNERAALRKAVRLLDEYSKAVAKVESEEAYNVLYALIKNAGLLHDWTATKKEVLRIYGVIGEDYASWHKRRARPVVRHIDFNQGLDARLATSDKMRKLATVAIRPLRIAFDDWSLRSKYVRAIEVAAENGILNLSNYLLYNFKDAPEDLYNRLRLNVELCDRLGVNIYSFPMKYHPITDPRWFSNRDFIGEKWCRKDIRMVQCVLNSTHGKIGRGKTFFLKAFGRDLEEFKELLILPEAFIVKRWDAEICGLRDKWRNALKELAAEERERAMKIVRESTFDPQLWAEESDRVQRFLSFYLIRREDVPEASEDEKRRAIAQWEHSAIGCPEMMCRLSGRR